MKYSLFGDKFRDKAGITLLMDDLADALSGGNDMLMLGGGNPGYIPAVQKAVRERMEQILLNGDSFEKVIGDYDNPKGDKKFIAVLTDYLKNEFGWDIGPENIALTNGSQTAFFYLFNMFSGIDATGVGKKILLPLVPEYIGYANIGMLHDDIFTTRKPGFEFIDDNTFKYHINFEDIDAGDDIGAICVSRPTNPTGNVLTNEEIQHLSRIAKGKDIPLIIDNAYGTPFPHIIYTDAEPFWDDHVIYCMSLSKLGLPGARTGIVIANEEIIEMISELNAVVSLAPGSFGTALSYELFKQGTINELCENEIMPFYHDKAMSAFDYLHKQMKGCDYALHVPEGAMFLWLWVKDLKISSMELYNKLKNAGVLVVSGHYFFPGIKDDWDHKEQCLRISYAQNDEVVKKGLAIIAEEIKKLET